MQDDSKMLHRRPDKTSNPYVAIGISAVFAVIWRLVLLSLLAQRANQGIVSYLYIDGMDSKSYLVCAEAYRGLPADVTPYDQRVFPGYPLLIAAANALGLHMVVAALAISWLSVVAVMFLCWKLYSDIKVGILSGFLIPAYLFTTSSVMNESLLCALCVAGVLAAMRGRPILAGLILGCAGAVRPNALFAFIGLVAHYVFVNRSYRDLAKSSLAAALPILLSSLFVWSTFGHPLASVRGYNLPGAYDGSILTWPFYSLVTTPLLQPTPLIKIAYVWSHVLAIVVACVVSIRLLKKNLTSISIINCAWLLGNTAFVFSMGNIWGFSGLPRALTWASPPLIYILSLLLPRHMAATIGAIFLSGLATVFMVFRG